MSIGNTIDEILYLTIKHKRQCANYSIYIGKGRPKRKKWKECGIKKLLELFKLYGYDISLL